MTQSGDRRGGEADIPLSHYLGSDFTTKQRFLSYWHQADEVLKREARSILEVGVGNQFLSDFIRRHGRMIVTADINPGLSPEVVCTIAALPFADGAFDMVVACQVLEHLPFASLEQALRELHRVTSRWVILSVPNSIRSCWLQVSVPRLGVLRYQRQFPGLARWPKVPDHHWEIGHEGVTERKLVELFEQTGFEIESSYRVLENPQHHFFVLAR